jgi:hypothetical protein
MFIALKPAPTRNCFNMRSFPPFLPRDGIAIARSRSNWQSTAKPNPNRFCEHSLDLREVVWVNFGGWKATSPPNSGFLAALEAAGFACGTQAFERRDAPLARAASQASQDRHGGCVRARHLHRTCAFNFVPRCSCLDHGNCGVQGGFRDAAERAQSPRRRR